MKELSLNILDIAQNSVAAGATRIDIAVIDNGPVREVSVRDDGCGMSPEFVERVTNPFTTTRTTRSVGLGIPLLKLAAEQTGGRLTIESKQRRAGETGHGTRIAATFFKDHVDCEPLGDLASTMVVLIQGRPDLHFTLTLRIPENEKTLDTDELREMLGPEVPLSEPEVLNWIAAYINEK